MFDVIPPLVNCRILDVLEAVPHLTWVADVEGELVGRNRQLRDYAGDQPGPFIHPDDYAAVIATWAARVRDGAPFDLECRLLRHDGQYLWHRLRAERSYENHWFGTSTDIDTLKQNARAIAERQERFRLLVRATNDVVWDWDIANDHVWWGDGNRMIFGYPVTDEVVWEPWWVERLHPDDRPRVLAHLDRALAAETDYGIEYRFRRPDGGFADVRSRGSVLRDAGGRAVRMLGVMHDLSDQRRTEESLRLRDRAIQAVSQGILIVDATCSSHAIVYASPGFERITGYTASEVVGRNARFLQGPDTDPAALEALRAFVHTGQGGSVEFVNYRKDGTPFWNALSVAPLHDADGRLTHYVGVQADVTAKKSLEAQFRQAQKMEEVGRLAAGIAHDFNNFLTVINGHCDLLLDELPTNDPSRSALEEIHNAGEQSAGLTRQLLAYSRCQLPSLRTFDLNALIRESSQMLRRMLGEDVRLLTDLSADSGAVRADSGQLEQVFMNLAVNARDAMPRGGTLTIATRNVVVNETPWVEVAVRDTGTGMDEETRARIFEPFYTTKSIGEGTGLGLAIVQSVVEQSGGTVTVESELGRGTTFRVRLPRVAAKAEVATVDLPTITGGRETVLLVEDERSVRDLVRIVLEQYGYTVLATADGDEALRRAVEFPGRIDLVVTDVIMPGMGGQEVADRLRALRPELAVLFLSGYSDNTVVRYGVKAGRVNFLAKPFTPTALAARVRAALDERQ